MAGDGRGGNGASIGASLKANDVDGQISEDEKMEKTMESGDRTASNWIPAFKWEDFGENSQIKFRNCPVSLPASFGGDCIAGRLDDPSPSPAEVEGGGLDLRLRLRCGPTDVDLDS
ncbi:hypothetical protein V2J09_015693 [Rumex salicifolius]